jgi:hypothetical protein
MRSQLDRAICGRYPKIFVNRHAQDSICCMRRGFEMHDGWYNLLCMLCGAQQKETDRHGMPQVIATQVKEKLGTLRFRVRGANEHQQTMIDHAERLSMHICTVCGKQSLVLRATLDSSTAM